MTERRRPFAPADLADDALERALRDLGPRLAFPPAPDLAEGVRERLAEGPAATGNLLRFPRPALALVAAAVLLALVVGLLALVPDARRAVADFLGVGGIRIEFDDGAAPTPTASLGASLLLGRPTTLAEAAAAAGYPVQVPTWSGLGEPDEVYLRILPDGKRMVSLLYDAAPGLPKAEETGVGALLMQFPADGEVVSFVKGIGSAEGSLARVEVGGADGYWIEGPSDLVLAPAPAAGGGPRGRPSANVLIWEADGLTFRLETALGRVAALELAESIAPR